MGREAGAQVTSQAGWGGGPCCVGWASPETGPARPPHAQDPSGHAFLERSSSCELPSQAPHPPHHQPEPRRGGPRPAALPSCSQGRSLHTFRSMRGDGGKVRGRRKSPKLPAFMPTLSPLRLGQRPGLKRTRAFMQANSVGSTASARNREMVSCRIRVSALASTSRPWELPPAEASGRASSGQLSRGRDHWMAPRRKSSLHASSSRITCAQRVGVRASVMTNTQLLWLSLEPLPCSQLS